MTSRTPFDAVDDLMRVLKRVSKRSIKSFSKELLDAERVFVTGLGRTGLMARGFAMRLMHVGIRVFHVGDVITPAIEKGDVLVICTRTGGSKVLRHYIGIARKAKARVVVVTARPESPVAERADTVLAINDSIGKQPRRHRPLPLGSLFEQALLVVLDLVVLNLMEALDLSEEDLRRIHTAFE